MVFLKCSCLFKCSDVPLPFFIFGKVSTTWAFCIGLYRVPSDTNVCVPPLETKTLQSVHAAVLLVGLSRIKSCQAFLKF